MLHAMACCVVLNEKTRNDRSSYRIKNIRYKRFKVKTVENKFHNENGAVRIMGF